ncbi:hypothetical protein J3L18_29605 [Mucilaginibacter gossypii]|uniref:hypothetical protein n=1 Tax=Mucilaginibacter gossypii TaxID=551996 RepID=UPI000DCC77F3|nr:MULTISPECIES: hypothetical protein [Mucilaginibacter]QTE37214.1 hypothetical protein J3L18_29605 [Mucilaginibacter gossypii]RAV57176.1 hypothetical protein DIU36_12690 [Mucilaginibacter rubeus]
MVAFETKERKIIITLSGDTDDYVHLYKSLLHLLGNQNPETPPGANEMYTITNLLSEMLPDSRQLR